MLARWLDNLTAGLRLMLMRPVARQHFYVSLPFVLVALALSLGLFAVIDYAQRDGIRFQDVRGSAFLGVYLGVGLLLAVISAHLDDDYPQLPVLLTVLASCLPFAAVLLSLFPYSWAQRQWAVWPLVLLLLYASVLIGRSLRVAFFRPGVPALLVPVVAMIGVAQFGWQNYYYPSVFDAYYPGEFDDEPAVDIERTLHAQHALVEQLLATVEPSQAHQTDVFFVGVGSSDRQTVFESETRFAESLLASRFDAQSRSLVLYNNADKLDTQPIANTYNLAHVLKGVGAKMQTDQDVLLLLLTSHGGDDATLAVELEDAPLRALDAQTLRQSLDDSGIRWRIIIISACFSGSFIDTLKDDYTLILTAASADRNSFGCSSDRELTVFGEALLKQALQEDLDLITAFTRARQLIRQWETEADLPTSNPQLHLGHKLRLKLGLPLPPAPVETPANDTGSD